MLRLRGREAIFRSCVRSQQAGAPGYGGNLTEFNPLCLCRTSCTRGTCAGTRAWGGTLRCARVASTSSSWTPPMRRPQHVFPSQVRKKGAHACWHPAVPLQRMLWW